MPRQEGVMFICDKCGKEEFVPYQTGLVQYYVNVAETGWTRLTVMSKEDEEKWLCPDCAPIFKRGLTEYLSR